MFVVSFVLSGRGLWDELITRPEESYWVWCVVCDLETLWVRRPWHTGGRSAKKKCNFLLLSPYQFRHCRHLQGDNVNCSLLSFYRNCGVRSLKMAKMPKQVGAK